MLTSPSIVNGMGGFRIRVPPFKCMQKSFAPAIAHPVDFSVFHEWNQWIRHETDGREKFKFLYKVFFFGLLNESLPANWIYPLQI